MILLIRSTVTLAALLACCALPAGARTAITVVGQGSASSMPDVATLDLTIATNAPTASSATSDNNAIYNRLEAALAALGIGGSQVRTTSYNVTYTPPPQPVPGTPIPQPAQEQYGYSVSRGVNVTVKNTASVGRAIDAAVSAGVNNVNSVNFGMADRRSQRAQAVRAAVMDARAQADAIAAAAGLRVVAIRTMLEGYTSGPITPAPMAAARMSVPTQIPPSNVQTEASVTITFDAR